MDIDKLKIELDTDPIGEGYAAMNNAQVVVSMNTINRTTQKATLTGSEVLNAVDKAEYLNLTAGNKQLMWNLVHVDGGVNPFGIEADLFIEAFGAGSTTLSVLAALRLNDVSRGVELGLGIIHEADIQDVRRMP